MAEQFESDLVELLGERIRADRAFAERVYASLCNVEWERPGADPYGLTWRQAGGLVAVMRASREDYLDFYCSGREGEIDPEISTALALRAWTPRLL